MFRAVPLLLLGCGREPPALPRKSWDLIRILLEFTGSKERGSPSTAVTHREERRGEEALTWSCELWQGGEVGKEIERMGVGMEIWGGGGIVKKGGMKGQTKTDKSCGEWVKENNGGRKGGERGIKRRLLSSGPP